MGNFKKIRSFSDLEAWKKSHELVLAVYKATDSFPDKELFGITNQLRRAGVSTASNIAEGFNRHSSKEKIRFYSISLGSVAEIQSQLLIARDIGYLESSDFSSLADKTIVVHKLLNGLIKKLRLRL